MSQPIYTQESRSMIQLAKKEPEMFSQEWLTWLSNVTGEGLVSLYWRRGGNKEDISKFLTHEISTASNIKKRITRQSVQESLRSMQMQIKRMKVLPKDGFIWLTVPGQGVICIDNPPFPIRKTVYICGRSLAVDPLRKMIEAVNLPMYGVVVVHGEKTICAESNGVFTNTIATHTAIFPNDHSRGGQSAQRFDRIGQAVRNKFVKDSVQMINESFFDFSIGKPKIIGLIIAGSGLFKDRVSTDIHPGLQSITASIRVTDSESAHYVFREAVPDIKKYIRQKEAEWTDKFNQIMELEPDRCSFTWPETYKALISGGIETILINKNKMETWVYTLKTPKGKISSVFRPGFFKVPKDYQLVKKEKLQSWLKENNYGSEVIELSDNAFDQKWGGSPVVGILRTWYASFA